MPLLCIPCKSFLAAATVAAGILLLLLFFLPCGYSGNVRTCAPPLWVTSSGRFDFDPELPTPASSLAKLTTSPPPPDADASDVEPSGRGSVVLLSDGMVNFVLFVLLQLLWQVIMAVVPRCTDWPLSSWT